MSKIAEWLKEMDTYSVEEAGEATVEKIANSDTPVEKVGDTGTAEVDKAGSEVAPAGTDEEADNADCPDVGDKEVVVDKGGDEPESDDEGTAKVLDKPVEEKAEVNEVSEPVDIDNFSAEDFAEEMAKGFEDIDELTKAFDEACAVHYAVESYIELLEDEGADATTVKAISIGMESYGIQELILDEVKGFEDADNAKGEAKEGMGAKLKKIKDWLLEMIRKFGKKLVELYKSVEVRAIALLGKADKVEKEVDELGNEVREVELDLYKYEIAGSDRFNKEGIKDAIDFYVEAATTETKDKVSKASSVTSIDKLKGSDFNFKETLAKTSVSETEGVLDWTVEPVKQDIGNAEKTKVKISKSDIKPVVGEVSSFLKGFKLGFNNTMLTGFIKTLEKDLEKLDSSDQAALLKSKLNYVKSVQKVSLNASQVALAKMSRGLDVASKASVAWKAAGKKAA